MSEGVKENQRLRTKRAQRIRRRLKTDTTRPRLSVSKTNKHIAVQIIDDAEGKTLVGLSTYSKEFKGSTKNKENAAKLGAKVAELAKVKGIEEVVLDRGASKYHGVIAALADAAREGGLKF